VGWGGEEKEKGWESRGYLSIITLDPYFDTSLFIEGETMHGMKLIPAVSRSGGEGEGETPIRLGEVGELVYFVPIQMG